ncbi:MAG: type II toxin-antitoxin system HicA family toxin [Nitrospinae bacterium]|nr:type II toxin-antitoxin system HicA family toxin [Nitrospinota bacterium]
MAKTPRLTYRELESMLMKAGFELVRIKGSHRIFMKSASRVVVPFHSGGTLHPKIIKKALETIKASS